MSDECEARRKQSIATLKAEGVPVSEQLPLLEPEAESTRRMTEEVATRALALCIVALKGEGLEREPIEKLIEEYDAFSAFTPDERKFIENPDPSQHDRIQFTWRYECLWVMLWALGFVDRFERPDRACDAGRTAIILLKKGRDAFFAEAELRPQSEILDAADLIYRYHWAVVDARINGRETPAGLDAGVVMERHYALNWLIGCNPDEEWDDIKTDT